MPALYHVRKMISMGIITRRNTSAEARARMTTAAPIEMFFKRVMLGF
jgi:hypothetical protein